MIQSIFAVPEFQHDPIKTKIRIAIYFWPPNLLSKFRNMLYKTMSSHKNVVTHTVVTSMVYPCISVKWCLNNISWLGEETKFEAPLKPICTLQMHFIFDFQQYSDTAMTNFQLISLIWSHHTFQRRNCLWFFNTSFSAPSKFSQAIHTSLGEWLHRHSCQLSAHRPDKYLQNCFRCTK